MATTLPSPLVDQISAVLARVPIFENVPRPELNKIAGLVRARTLRSGDVLYRKGEPGDKLYIIQSGAVELLDEPGDAAAAPLAIKGPGDALGEMALVTDAPRPATARACEQTNLLVIPRAQFAQLVGADTLAPHCVYSFAKSLAALSLRGYNQSIQSALLPAESPQPAEFEIVGGMARELYGNAHAMWDAFPFKGGGLVYAVFEARGPTLAPAHTLATTRALLREIASSEDRFERVLTRLNRAVYGSLAEDAATSVGVALIHVVHVITFAIAGDYCALVVKDGECVNIGQHGPAIGAIADYSYGTTRAELEKADFAVVVSKPEPELLTGAAKLIRNREAEPLDETVPLIAAWLLRTQQRAQGEDVAFVIARRM